MRVGQGQLGYSFNWHDAFAGRNHQNFSNGLPGLLLLNVSFKLTNFAIVNSNIVAIHSFFGISVH